MSPRGIFLAIFIVICLVMMVVGFVAALIGLGGSESFELSLDGGKLKTSQTGLAIMGFGGILGFLAMRMLPKQMAAKEAYDLSAMRLPQTYPNGVPDDAPESASQPSGRRARHEYAPEWDIMMASPTPWRIAMRVFAAIAVVAYILLIGSFLFL